MGILKYSVLDIDFWTEANNLVTKSKRHCCLPHFELCYGHVEYRIRKRIGETAANNNLLQGIFDGLRWGNAMRRRRERKKWIQKMGLGQRKGTGVISSTLTSFDKANPCIPYAQLSLLSPIYRLQYFPLVSRVRFPSHFLGQFRE